MDCDDSYKLVFIHVRSFLDAWEDCFPIIKELIEDIDDNSRQLTICRKSIVQETLLCQKFPNIQRALEVKIYWSVEDKYSELNNIVDQIKGHLLVLIHKSNDVLISSNENVEEQLSLELSRDNPTVIDWIDEILYYAQFHLSKLSKFFEDDSLRTSSPSGSTLREHLIIEGRWVHRLEYMLQYIHDYKHLKKKTTDLNRSSSMSSSPSRA